MVVSEHKKINAKVDVILRSISVPVRCYSHIATKTARNTAKNTVRNTAIHMLRWTSFCAVCPCRWDATHTHTVTHCNVLQQKKTNSKQISRHLIFHVAQTCVLISLPSMPTPCNTQQHSATLYNTLNHIEHVMSHRKTCRKALPTCHRYNSRCRRGGGGLQIRWNRRSELLKHESADCFCRR